MTAEQWHSGSTLALSLMTESVGMSTTMTRSDFVESPSGVAGPVQLPVTGPDNRPASAAILLVAIGLLLAVIGDRRAQRYGTIESS